MVKKLKISELKFGKTDAFNELNAYGEIWFKKAFFNYDKYNIDDFMIGKKYYLCGDKGSGKTSFLRYLQCQLSENPENLIIPIRFKSDLDNEDKKNLVVASNIKNVKETTITDLNTPSENSDAVLVWMVYIINKIFSYADTQGEFEVFKDTTSLNKLSKLLKILYPEVKTRILPKIKHGQIKISTNILKTIDTELMLDLEADINSQAISFSRLGKAIVRLYSELESSRNSAYVIFDELELSVRSKSEHNRDVKLVRDLVLAIDKLNNINRQNSYNVFIMASIRNEVLNSVDNVGYEINKCIEDFGIIISWCQKGGSYNDNKLLNIIENKIIACEEEANIIEHGDIWSKYFPKKIHKMETKRYILGYTWMHPRDIIRLMNYAQSECNNNDKIFLQEHFDKAMKAYSAATWKEISEELILMYTSDELQLIKMIFTNIEVPFTFQYLIKRTNDLKQVYPEIELFFKNHTMSKLLNDLFKLGVIGNTGQRMVFKFLGDEDLAITEDMIIHKPLRNFFAVKSRKN